MVNLSENLFISNVILLLQQGYRNSIDLMGMAKQLSFLGVDEGLNCKAAVGYRSKRFPFKLRELLNPPIVIFLYGDNYMDFSRCIYIALAGSRNINDEVDGCISKFMSNMYRNREKVVFISGGAVGVDRYCVKIASNNGFKQIVIAPAINERLLKLTESMERVSAITLYPKSAGIRKEMFLERNSVIAALCDALVVFKANRYSGTVNVANTALRLGRKVFVYDPSGSGLDGYLGNIDILNKGGMELDNLYNFLDSMKESV